VNLLRAIIEIATGRARGLERFGATPRDFLRSLYVLMAVPGISILVLMGRRGLGVALAVLLLLLCALLAPPVISHAMARLWGREAEWLRFAVAFNWSRFAVLAVFAIALMAISVLIGLGMPPESAGQVMVAGMSGYSLWLEWFIARHGLRISAGRALATVLAINVGTFLLLGVPSMIVRGFMAETVQD